MPSESEMYIRLVWLFVVIITILVLSLFYQYLTMKRAQKRETQINAFSNLMIDGMETERRRISRELHDTILPQVAVLPAGRAVADEIRSICMELQPPDFSRISLADALADLCTQFTRRSGIECVCSINEDLNFSSVSPENQLHLYRIIQEAFTNIEKHSGSNSASLVARLYTSKSILICVSDDGQGLRGTMPGGERLGMRSMRQRAAITGAALDFISESGNGLMVRIEIPIREIGT
jgi:two-component system NarL family sensor kinase